MASPPPDFVAPPWLVWLRRYIWVVAGVLGVVTLTLLRPVLRRDPDPPPVMFELPRYELVDQAGRPFTPDTYKGRVWVAGFVFTRCPSSCPVVTRAMADLRESFDRAGLDVGMVSISVDPEHDTVLVLAEHAADVGADGDRWRWVTGDLGAIRALVVDGFRLGVGQRQSAGGAGSGLYDIAHSTKLALVDSSGGVRGYYGIEPEALEEIFHRAMHVMREERAAERP